MSNIWSRQFSSKARSADCCTKQQYFLTVLSPEEYRPPVPQRLNLGLDRGEAVSPVREFMSLAKYGDSAAISKNERSIAMRTTRVIRASVSAILLAFFLLPAAAHATDVTVVCPGQSINTAL